MESVIKLLRKNEWAMGNGQCDTCKGMGPRMFSLHNYEKGIRFQSTEMSSGRQPIDFGHRKDCLVAKALNEIGEYTIMRGY